EQPLPGDTAQEPAEPALPLRRAHNEIIRIFNLDMGLGIWYLRGTLTKTGNASGLNIIRHSYLKKVDGGLYDQGGTG
ncbi:MAG TPA: hypothetical protein VJM83_05070, partial [Nitrospirota bacterium]|nr:hypothetical protein [Nitrospirota bacterium]